MQYKIRETAEELAALVEEKNKAYGESFEKVGWILRYMLAGYYDRERKAYIIPGSLLDQLAVIVRMLDKLNRIAANPDGDMMQESPWQDIAGYGLLMVAQEKTMIEDKR